MFPLPTTIFPASVSDLAGLMKESLARVFETSGDPITIDGDAYPTLQALRISLDGARLRSDAPRPPTIVSALSPALQVDQFHLGGSRLWLGPAVADLRLTARNVWIDQGLDAKKEIVLTIRRASEGKIELAAYKSELEKTILAVASREAAKQGVTIEDVRLTLDARGSRGLSGEIEVKAKKLFFTTVIRIAGRLDLDEQLNAKLSGLACQGDGAIGSLACGALSPHLKKLEGRALSLLALSLGDIRLHDVRLSTTDGIVVQAEFGA